jgi:hypothetical protein
MVKMLNEIYIYKGKHRHVVHQGNKVFSLAGNTSTGYPLALVTTYPSTLEGRKKGCQFNRLLAAEVCTSALVMLDMPCSEVV